MFFADRIARNIVSNGEYYQYVFSIEKPPHIAFPYREIVLPVLCD